MGKNAGSSFSCAFELFDRLLFEVGQIGRRQTAYSCLDLNARFALQRQEAGLPCRVSRVNAGTVHLPELHRAESVHIFQSVKGSKQVRRRIPFRDRVHSGDHGSSGTSE